jgi:hypothetical protein
MPLFCCCYCSMQLHAWQLNNQFTCEAEHVRHVLCMYSAAY